jgi:hypothetical protein
MSELDSGPAVSDERDERLRSHPPVTTPTFPCHKHNNKGHLRIITSGLDEEAAGIAPASREAQTLFLPCPYGEHRCFWLEIGWELSASDDTIGRYMTLPPELRRVIAAWPFLPRHVVGAILLLLEAAAKSPA